MSDQFCDECGVTRDLHYLAEDEDPTPADCEQAGAKADLLDAFASFGRGAGR